MLGSLMEEAKLVFLEVTNYCNFRCSFCPQAISTRKPEHMDTELAKDLIGQLYEIGYRDNLYFHLLGEPFLHPDIFEIVKFASKRIPRSILFTNGSLLTEENIESAFAACPFELMVSMQLIDEKSFKLRGSSMGWTQYVTRIRNAVHYKLTHNTPTQLRVSVGIRKGNTIYPEDDHFPRVSSTDLRAKILGLFSTVPSLDSQHLHELLASVEIPFEGRLELAPEVSVSIKPMGNWRRIYRAEKVEKGYCPHVGKEFGVLSNGNIVLCYLDHDGKTTFANVRDGELQQLVQNPRVEQEIIRFREEGVVPKGCQYCSVPHRYSRAPNG